MKYVMVYWSRFGHNKKIVNYLSEKLKDKPAETQIMSTDEADPTKMPDADFYIFSAPTEAFNLQKNMRKFMKNLEGLDKKNYAIINTHGMNKNWLPKMEKLLSKKNMVKVAEVDFQIGKDSKSGNAFVDDWESKLDDFSKKI
jgi:menaquinone-dependent protoporphyrinogen IX oxidase